MDAEKKNIVAEDLPKFLSLMQELGENCQSVSNSVDKTMQKITDGLLDTTDGLSFLDVKSHLVLSYLINLTYVMLRKAKGEKIEGEASVERIVEIRTVLEKMRPIEQKLKYQIDKLVKTAVTGVANKEDPLQFTAKPENLIPKLDVDADDDNKDDDDDSESGGKKNKAGIYVPPKVAALHYDGDLTVKDREKQIAEKNRKRALSSRLMQELHQEYFDGPEEITEGHRGSRHKAANERTRYEEEHFVRMQLPKKKMKKAHYRSTLKDITEFGSSLALLNDD